MAQKQNKAKRKGEMVMLKKMYDLQKKKGKKGFSMIELIIVIAIMAVLMALIGTQLLPYMEKSRERKDQSTMDSCLTNFRSAIANAEYTAPSAGVTFNGISGLPTDVKSEYETLAGAYDTDTKLTATFKSKEAKGGTVTFGITSEGICYVEVKGTGSDSKKGGLYVSEKFTGYKKDAPTTSGGSSSPTDGK